jgi:3-dehydroquinate synthetase
MVAAANLATELGECSPQVAARIKAVIERVGLPTTARGYDVDKVLAAMGHDKKRTGKTLRFIIPREIGDVVIIDSPGDETVRRALASVLT